MPRRTNPTRTATVIATTIATFAMLTALVGVPASAEPQAAAARAAGTKVAIKKGPYVGQLPPHASYASPEPVTLKVTKSRYVTLFTTLFYCPVADAWHKYTLQPAPMKVNRKGWFAATWNPDGAPTVTAAVSGKLTSTGKVKSGLVSVADGTCTHTLPWTAKRVR